jgi:signal transduction histidine kinase
MSLRRKLLAVFALTVLLSVSAVTWIVLLVTRRAFEESAGAQTASWAAQFRREFNRRGEDVARDAEAIAASETAARIALALGHESLDYGSFLNEAKTAAEDHQLDYLEFLDDQGTIISSAQWAARFGYKDASLPGLSTLDGQPVFLKREELPDGAALGIFAVRKVKAGEQAMYVAAGKKVDRSFLAGMELPTGMRALLYENLAPGFSPEFLMDPSGKTKEPGRLAPLVERVQAQGREQVEVLHWSDDAAEDESIRAIPLNGADGRILAILLVGTEQKPFVDLERHIRTSAVLVGGAGALIAVLFSGWAARRVTRPVEELAGAARSVAGGAWGAQVKVSSADELGQLAESFNHMTRQLLEQKEQLVQAERVAAWRELARRLAHELKNPLFPLQLTVENLVRAREQTPEEFEEVLRESSSTLLAEIGNLKKIIASFSDFARMPQPQLQTVKLNEVVEAAARLFQAQMTASGQTAIGLVVDLDQAMPDISADPELLHRVLSNLILNAIDAMPNGGTITLRTRSSPEHVSFEVADDGTGLTPEECKRLFTPYYTSKRHGTGLGLAIVQSVISDHKGKISVRSEPGRGTSFLVELPRDTGGS